MIQTIEAIYENGVFVPVHLPAIAENQRVRLTIETITIQAASAIEVIEYRRNNRLRISEQLAEEIVKDPT